MPHNSLIDALQAADMLEIDGLYAWQFSLDNELLAQVSAGSADADSQQKPLLKADGLDGSTRRHWQFSLAAVLAARFDPEGDCWRLSEGEQRHLIKCFAAISADNAQDDDDAPSGDDA
ncbi:DUF5629 family protein [Pseudomonas lalucatii]|uniref:DUF5629 family protein n=1 Tax=Pseudomonas lalucatii TaxID=1424203 RepID=A0ABS5Q5Q4_9PSED|nr:DUF5629 family protein [Pseudomonas lalucatii]MBS7725416.1 DUF5629 family protein [Pseudomonas lalucatii]QVM88901.1 DUF5629 family protein [Pseudomonas lalucatii]